MPLKASIGLSKKIGQENYGSLGASCHLELELDASLIEDADAFHEKIRHLYTLAHQSIVDQLSRYAANGNGTIDHGQDNGSSNGRFSGSSRYADPNSGNGDGADGEDTPASNKQIKYLLDLARQQHDMNISRAGEFCEKLVGISDVYRLTKSQASLIIDRLAGNNGSRTSRGRSRVNGRR